jgi:hypothetical protein
MGGQYIRHSLLKKLWWEFVWCVCLSREMEDWRWAELTCHLLSDILCLMEMRLGHLVKTNKTLALFLYKASLYKVDIGLEVINAFLEACSCIWEILALLGDNVSPLFDRRVSPRLVRMMESAPAKRSKFTYRHLHQLSKYSVDTPLRVIALVWVTIRLGPQLLTIGSDLDAFYVSSQHWCWKKSIDDIYPGTMWDEKVGGPGWTAISRSAVAECVVFGPLSTFKICGSNSG